MNDWKSADLDKLAPALLAAQRALAPAIKECKNPAFKSKYADLNAVIDAVTEAFHPHGLVVTQLPMPLTGPSGEVCGVIIKTVVLHAESGQWIASDLPMLPEMGNPQKIGGSVTYGRRYGLAAVSCLTQEDDDGETSNGRGAGYDYDRNPVGNGNAPRNGNGGGHQGGNGNGGEKKAFDGPPRNGAGLYAWAKDTGTAYGVDLIAWLGKWGQSQRLPGTFKDWPDDAVRDGHAAALAAIGKRETAQHGRGEANEEALSN